MSFLTRPPELATRRQRFVGALAIFAVIVLCGLAGGS